MTRAAALLVLVLVLAGCAGDNTSFLNNYTGPPAPPLLGEPAQYVCLRAASAGCLRGEWRCAPPLHLRAADDGRPRCVMPGGP